MHNIHHIAQYEITDILWNDSIITYYIISRGNDKYIFLANFCAKMYFIENNSFKTFH